MLIIIVVDEADSLNNEIQKMEHRCVDRHNNLAKNFNQLNRQQARILSKGELDNAKEVVSHLYGKANSYSNLIIAAGYVGFFSLWASVKKDLPLWGILISGTLILLSLICFVGFEVYKMISSSLLIRAKLKKLNKENLTFNEIAELERKAAQANAKVWVFTLIPTLAFAILGVSILLFCFISNFIKVML